MDLNQLNYFRTIVECGSLTAAARKLGVSQPTLTVAVKKLEERFGTTLLMRNPRGVTITSTGQELLNNIMEIFSIVSRAEERIFGLESAVVGDFVIGCHESLGAYFLPDFMRPFIQRAPQVQITLWNGSSEEVYQAVVKRTIHFGLIVNPLPHPDLVLVDLFSDAVDLFIASDDPLPVDSSLADALDRLRVGPLIFAGRINQSRQLIDQLAGLDALPTRHLSCGDLELVRSLTLGGLGVGVIPRRVASYNMGGRLRRLHDSLPNIPDRIFLAYRADMHRTKGAMLLKDALVTHGKELAGEEASLALRPVEDEPRP